MGQYYQGNKIGTCDMMFYLRLSKAQELAETGSSDDDDIPFADYLKDGSTKFRFPFPGEDGKDLVTIQNHAPAVQFPALNLNLNHSNIVLATGSTNNVNIFVPCVYSQEFKDLLLSGKVRSSGVGTQYIDVVMQAVRENKTRTVFQCSKCKSMAWFTEDDIAEWKEKVIPLYTPVTSDDETQKLKKEEMLEIIKRIS